MNIVEIKIEKAGVVLFHNFCAIDAEAELEAHTTKVIQSVTKCRFDEDDQATITDFRINGEMSSRFGADWEFDVQAISLSLDECDIDLEFDSIHDKYSLSL